MAGSAPTVRRVEARDLPTLRAFHRRYSPDRARLNNAAIWHWEFDRRRNARGEIPYFVLDTGDRIEGAVGYVPLTLRAGGAEHESGHPVDFFVEEAHRGLPALRLIKAVMAELPTAFAGYVSDDARRLFGKLGYRDLSTAFGSWYCPLRSPDGRLLNFLKAVARAAWLAAVTVAAQAATFGRLRHAVTERPPEGFPVAGEEQGFGAANHILKSPAWLDWRYGQHPALTCFYVVQYRAGRPRALAVAGYESDPGRLLLLDAIGPRLSWAARAALILALVRAARRRGALDITTHLAGPLARSLRFCGFSRTSGTMGFLVYARDVELLKRLSVAADWHFTLGDTDRH
jgi:hypothetical protein